MRAEWVECPAGGAAVVAAHVRAMVPSGDSVRSAVTAIVAEVAAHGHLPQADGLALAQGDLGFLREPGLGHRTDVVARDLEPPTDAALESVDRVVELGGGHSERCAAPAEALLVGSERRIS
ncbi:MAG: hypothetical protein H0V26_01455, partial [Solirubrobacterales bacterium]|nr:hypothetical protein [Solirubrobacterales bacterium]